MREFALPFKPEELLAPAPDGRLWAQDLPPVDAWSPEETNAALDSLAGRLLASQGRDVAEDDQFSLLFALLQAWTRLESSVHARIVDLLVDAARRLAADATRLKKAERASGKAKEATGADHQADMREARTASKVAVFFLRWAAERCLRTPTEAVTRRRGKGAKRGAEEEVSAEEAKERQRSIERQRCGVLAVLADTISKAPMPWLWQGDAPAWQQVAEKVSDGGFLVLDSEPALKHRETRQQALRCVTEPLLQEGHQHSNLLVATVSKLAHGLRSGELAAPFAADALLQAHTTPLPRLLLVELTNHCTGSNLTSQGIFQRALGAFLVGLAERLPHVVLANISVLLPLLDVDCYPLRSAIVESIGQLLQREGQALPRGAHIGTGDAEAAVSDALVPLDGTGAQPAESQADVVPGEHFHLAASTKNDLLETLLARSVDKTVWVRVRTLSTLNGLASRSPVAALPKDLWHRVLEIATRRMQDSACSARKAAIALARTLIERHPYGPALKGSGDERSKAEKLLHEVADRFQKLAQEEADEAEAAAAAGAGGPDIKMEPEDGDGSEDQKTQVAAGRRRLGKKTQAEDTSEKYEVDRLLSTAGAADEAGEEDRLAERERQRSALKKMHSCYTQRLRFVELIDAAEACLRALLKSRTSSDVIESIGVVVELKLRGLPAAARAFNQVLGLVWSRHAPIKDAATEAFHRMHLEGRDAASAVRSLLEMYQVGCGAGGWTYTHLASVQELIQQAASQELFDPQAAIPELVEALSEPATCPMALRTLTAVAAANAGGLGATLPQLTRLFGPSGPCLTVRSAERLERVRLLCQLLQRLHSSAPQPLGAELRTALTALSERATQVVVEHYARADVPPQWFGAAQAAVDLCFDLAGTASQEGEPVQRCPDKLWEQILERMLLGLLSSAAEDAEASEGATRSEVPLQQLAGVVFLAGHLALRMLVYMEGLHASLKRQRISAEDARLAEQREKAKQRKKSKKGAEEPEAGGEASSMGMAGLEEREAEAFHQLAEQGLLYSSKSILNRVRPMVLAGLLDPAQRTSPVLRRCAAISLCKFMTVSKRFCEDHIQLLFSVLFPKGAGESSTALVVRSDATQGEVELAVSDSAVAADAATAASGGAALLEDLTLRQSLLVAVGDLLFRHPNVVEPWSDRLYAALGAVSSSGEVESGNSSSATELRLTALLVLTHLVLNDMMKPRAVLLVRALWLTACPHESTARVARILFQELSKRSTNVVYNLLPEIIARLPEQQQLQGSATEGVAEGRVQYIMQFVEKEKHVEGLTEKLTVRLEQAANLAGGGAAATASAVPPPPLPAASLGLASADDAEAEATAEAETDAEVPSLPRVAAARATEAVSCLAHALGAMNYSDRCVLRLHDIIVVRKALNTAISYHQVVRDCLLNIVEKTRKPRAGKEKAGGAGELAAADVEAAAGDAAGGAQTGASAAAAAALDAIEEVVNAAIGKTAKEEEEEAPEPNAAEEPQGPGAAVPTPARAGGRQGRQGGDGAKAPGGGGKGSKRKAAAVATEEATVDGADGAPAAAATRGEEGGARSGRGRGGRGTGSAAPALMKEKSGNLAKAATSTSLSGGDELRAALRSGAGRGRGRGRGPKRMRVDDEED